MYGMRACAHVVQRTRRAPPITFARHGCPLSARLRALRGASVGGRLRRPSTSVNVMMGSARRGGAFASCMACARMRARRATSETRTSDNSRECWMEGGAVLEDRTGEEDAVVTAADDYERSDANMARVRAMFEFCKVLRQWRSAASSAAPLPAVYAATSGGRLARVRAQVARHCGAAQIFALLREDLSAAFISGTAASRSYRTCWLLARRRTGQVARVYARNLRAAIAAREVRAHCARTSSRAVGRATSCWWRESHA